MTRATLTVLVVILGVLPSGARPAPPAASPSASLVDQIETRLRAGDPDGALEAGEREVRESPGSARLWLSLGEAYGAKAQAAPVLSRLGLARKCRAAFETAVRLDPGNVEAWRDLFHYDLQAPGIAGGSRELARREAGEILKLDAARGHAARGALAASEGDHAAAEAEFRLALETSPESGEARAGLGDLLLEQKRYDEARRLWRDVAPGTELEMTAHYQLARTCLLSGTDLADGVEHLQAYLSRAPGPGEPSLADARWQLALLYEKQGRKPEAIDALRQALRLEPAHSGARKDLKRLGG